MCHSHRRWGVILCFLKDRHAMYSIGVLLLEKLVSFSLLIYLMNHLFMSVWTHIFYIFEL